MIKSMTPRSGASLLKSCEKIGILPFPPPRPPMDIVRKSIEDSTSQEPIPTQSSTESPRNGTRLTVHLFGSKLEKVSKIIRTRMSSGRVRGRSTFFKEQQLSSQGNSSTASTKPNSRIVSAKQSTRKLPIARAYTCLQSPRAAMSSRIFELTKAEVPRTPWSEGRHSDRTSIVERERYSLSPRVQMHHDALVKKRGPHITEKQLEDQMDELSDVLCRQSGAEIANSRQQANRISRNTHKKLKSLTGLRLLRLIR